MGCIGMAYRYGRYSSCYGVGTTADDVACLGFTWCHELVHGAANRHCDLRDPWRRILLRLHQTAPDPYAVVHDIIMAKPHHSPVPIMARPHHGPSQSWPIPIIAHPCHGQAPSWPIPIMAHLNHGPIPIMSHPCHGQAPSWPISIIGKPLHGPSPS